MKSRWNRIDAVNVAAAVGALALVAAVMLPRGASTPDAARAPLASPLTGRPPTVVEVDGRPAVVDATGAAVAQGDYRRIVAGSTVARELLIELVEPGRLRAVIDYDLDAQPDAYRFAGIERIATAKNAEAMLALAPDLIVVHGMGDAALVTRMREAGLRVFDLGTMRGTDDLASSALHIGHLIGAPARAERLMRGFFRRFAQVDADVPTAGKKTAIYASVFGDRVFGGTVGSSFHELLEAAGLLDAAASSYTGWPRYGPEDLLALDPDIIVTQVNMGKNVCALPGADTLRACADGRRGIVEVPNHVLNTPGLSMLEAAERIRAGAYPSGAP